MTNLLQDIQYAFRLLRKRPGFTVIAVLTLALGIGANTAVFSVINSFLLNPLPYNQPDRLVVVQRTDGPDEPQTVYSYPVLSDLREQVQSFDGVAAFAYRRLTLDGADGPETVFGATVTGNFFSVLGVTPTLGRAFLPGEDEPNRPKLAILSHGLWQRRFGGDAEVIGQTFTSDKETVEVVGVMPPDMRFDLVPKIPRVEFWMPLNPSPRMTTSRNINWLGIIARLKPGVTLAETRSELEVIAERIKQSPDRPANIAGQPADQFTLSAVTIKEFFVGDARRPLLVLLGAVGFVLLIACVNVANLLLAHGAGRQKEVAIRAVLGADRRRLVSQMLTESLMLSLAGGLLSLLLLMWSIDVINWLAPKWMTRMDEIALDWKVFLFTLSASLFTGVLFGLLPSVHASRVDLQSTLKASASTASRRRGFLSTLVVAEVALAVVLLVGAGLMINSFVRLTRVDVGFNPQNVLSMQFRSLSRTKQPEQLAFAEEVLDRLRGLPGVSGVAIIDGLPVGPGSTMSNKRVNLIEGPISGDPDADLTIQSHSVTTGYFQTMGIRLVKGRLFTDSDTVDSQPVVVVSERLAQEAWPGEDPIGRRLLWGWAKDMRVTVIGVVNDTRHSHLSELPAPILYAPFSQNPSASGYLAVRTTTDPLSVTADIRSNILNIDRRVVIGDIMTFDERLGELIAQPRFYAVLLGWFGAMGMALAMIGLYGVISYSVSQRTQEIGIRMALGADRRSILRLVVTQGMMLTLTGVVVGVMAAFALTRFLSSLLFGVSETDPATFAITLALLSLAALAACYIPARRATRVDPIVALRYE